MVEHMNNTIRLIKGYRRLTNTEFKKFEKGAAIWGDSINVEEIKSWSIEQEEEAKEELKKYNCKYSKFNEQLVEVEEYALEYFVADEDGELLAGSDYQMAECKKFAINTVHDKNCNFEYIAIVGGEEVTTTSEETALIFDNEIDAKNYMSGLKDDYDFLEVVEIL